MHNPARWWRAGLATVARAALLALGALAAPGASHAQGSSWPGRIEILPVRSQTLPLDAFLRGDKTGPEVLLGGELRLPFGASGRVPAVILIHGSGGIGSGPDMWAHVLNEAGIAAFILDSFSGRNIVSTVEDQDQLNSLSMTLDAYRALDVLAAHPRIRPDRIAVWGFSKGAVPAVYAAVERFRTSFGSQSRFAAHVGFYTPCNIAYDGDGAMGGVPIRLYHGSSDDYVNPAACRTLVSRLKPAGVDIALTEYADSQHGFDSPTSPPLLAVPKAQSTRNCRLKEGPNGTLVDADTGQPYELKTASCVAIGAHVGHNAQATEAVRADVMTFLTTTLLK
jgi:dienelactone hydrolase